MTWHLPYRKALIALVGVLGQAIALGLLHGTALSVAQLTVAGLTAAGVYSVPNVQVDKDADGGQISVVELCVIAVALILFFAFFKVSLR